MSAATLPLVLVALVILSLDGTPVDRVEILASGSHEVTSETGALVVADADAHVGTDAVLEGPVYVVGGTFRVEGTVRQVTQLAGSVVVGRGGEVGELRAYGGELTDDGGDVGRVTTLGEVTSEPDRRPRPAALALPTAVFAVLGVVMTRRRPDNVDNLGHAVRHHPVVAMSVGLLIVLGGLSLLVFMAFTLVLLPVAVAGAMIGLLLIAVGLVGWARVLASPRGMAPGRAVSVAAIILIVPALTILGRIPLVGDPVVIGVLLIGIGASAMTFFGYRRFQPPRLPGVDQ